MIYIGSGFCHLPCFCFERHHYATDCLQGPPPGPPQCPPSPLPPPWNPQSESRRIPLGHPKGIHWQDIHGEPLGGTLGDPWGERRNARKRLTNLSLGTHVRNQPGHKMRELTTPRLRGSPQGDHTGIPRGVTSGGGSSGKVLWGGPLWGDPLGVRSSDVVVVNGCFTWLSWSVWGDLSARPSGGLSVGVLWRPSGK